jgi:adenine-specific DNA-methyltransferase
LVVPSRAAYSRQAAPSDTLSALEDAMRWVGKDERPRLSIEPRILVEEPARSYHAKQRVTDRDIFDNILIHGDNLLALKALEQDYRGRVKCVYLDPPFNTGAAFEHYDDGVEHSLWLALMRERLELVRGLMRDDGVLWLHLDDSEAAYAKVLLDEVFGRSNYRNTITVAANSPFGFKHTSKNVFKSANQLLVYAKTSEFDLRKSHIARGYDKAYKYVLRSREEDYQAWSWSLISDVVAESGGFATPRDAKKAWGAEELDRRVAEYAILNADRVFRTASVTGGARKKRLATLERSAKERDQAIRHPGDDMDYYFIAGERVLFYEERLVEIDGELVPGEVLTDIWTDISWEGIAREGGVDFPKGKKPEALLRRILDLSTCPGDLVLDSFAGSGTTGAVAHKMGRRWAMIEVGNHCSTHVIPRLKQVVDGLDLSGVSGAAQWRGGGGFRLFRLASSLLERDARGQWVISKDYNPAMLAEALCKHEGFRYEPSPTVYWQHGHSTERDFIYVTTQTLTREALQRLGHEVGPQRSLLVCCAAHEVLPEGVTNLTLEKIPKALMDRCEWGRDDYSLAVAALPKEGGEAADEAAEPNGDVDVGRAPTPGSEPRTAAAVAPKRAPREAPGKGSGRPKRSRRAPGETPGLFGPESS